MEIGIDEEWLKVLYDVLVDIYKETDTPITVGYNEGMINVCVERPQTGIYDFIPFPHFPRLEGQRITIQVKYRSIIIRYRAINIESIISSLNS